MRIAVCDDERAEQEKIISHIRQYDSSLPVDCFSAAGELLSADCFYDIIFMDIEMPSPNGYEVAKQLMAVEDKPLIIFVTNSGDYTIRGYGVAFRYLRKPVSYEYLAEVLDLALETVRPKKLTVTVGGRTVVLSLRDVYYFEIFSHQLYIHTRDESYTSWSSLGDMMEQLEGGSFAQPHKSYYVNLSHIDYLTKNEIVLTNHARIPLSLRRREEFLAAFKQYLRRN